jgi:YHS domain-containing protein
MRWPDGHESHKDELGKLHRVGGPALVDANGDEYYFKHGRLHRTEGAAIKKKASGKKYFYCNGVFLGESPPRGFGDD